MKPRHSPILRSMVVGATLLVASTALPVHAAKPVRTIESAPAAPRDHHLFAGIELFLVHEGELLPVRSFSGNDAMLARPSGEPVRVANANGYKWRLRPKVSPVIAEIHRIKTERAYSPWSDPARDLMNRQIALVDYAADQINAAEVKYARDLSAVNAAQQMERAGVALGPGETSTALAAQANSAFSNARASFQTLQDPSLTSPGPRRENETIEYDAIKLEFVVSAPTPTAGVHVLAMLRLSTADDGYRDFSFHREVGSIGPDPVQVSIYQPGLPVGYKLVSTQLHLFSHGHEIATNHSEQHLPLTAAEAREFALLDHVSSHRGEDVAAAPMWALAPPALRATADAAALDCPVTIDLDADGRLVSIHDPAPRILPPLVRDVLDQLTFLPALERGEAVAGTLTLNPADYFR